MEEHQWVPTKKDIERHRRKREREAILDQILEYERLQEEKRKTYLHSIEFIKHRKRLFKERAKNRLNPYERRWSWVPTARAMKNVVAYLSEQGEDAHVEALAKYNRFCAKHKITSAMLNDPTQI